MRIKALLTLFAASLPLLACGAAPSSDAGDETSEALRCTPYSSSFAVGGVEYSFEQTKTCNDVNERSFAIGVSHRVSNVEFTFKTPYVAKLSGHAPDKETPAQLLARSRSEAASSADFRVMARVLEMERCGLSSTNLDLAYQFIAELEKVPEAKRAALGPSQEARARAHMLELPTLGVARVRYYRPNALSTAKPTGEKCFATDEWCAKNPTVAAQAGSPCLPPGVSEIQAR